VVSDRCRVGELPWAGLPVFPPSHGVLAVKVCAALAACGRLRTCDGLRCAVRCRSRAIPPDRLENIVDKSFVSLEQRLCVVCGATFDTGNVLLDRRLRARMPHHTTTGWGLCPEHRRLDSEGFVALVECDPRRSGARSVAGRLQPDQAFRTGRLVHIRRDAFARVFDVPIAADQTVVFVEPGVIERLQSMLAPGD
jgi:hypothetical protein